MNIPHAWAHAELITRILEGGEDLHAVASCLDAGDIRVQVAHRVDKLIELGVAHVSVDLDGIGCPGRCQSEAAHGPLQVGRLVGLAQRQELADGGLIDLDDLGAGVDEVADLITQGQGHLVGGVSEGLVVAHEAPGEHRYWAGEHALDGLVGEALRHLVPFHGHRLWAVHIAVDDWWADAAGAIALHPRVVSGEVAFQLLAEVLHHVVALRLAVDEHVEPQCFLAADHVANFVDHGLLVGLSVDLASTPPRPRAADFPSLWEGADGGGRQWRQVEGLALSFLAFLD